MKHFAIVAHSKAPAAVIAAIAISSVDPTVAEREAAIAAKIKRDNALVNAKPKVVTSTISAVVDRAGFAAAVAKASHIVQRRNTIPILANVLLKGTGDGITVTGTDLDLQITCPVPGSAGLDFCTTLPAHTLSDILKKAKACDKVAIDVARTTTSGHRRTQTEYDKPSCVEAYEDIVDSAVLNFDGLRVTLQALPSTDFPVFEKVKFDNTFTMATAIMARALKRVEFCISTEETRYYLNGVHMHIGARNGLVPGLFFVATDGHRLGRVETAQPDGCGYMPGVIIPAKTVAEFLRLSKGKTAPENVTVKVCAAKIEYQIGDVTLLSKNIDGTFPDYGRVIPTGNDKRLAIGAKSLATGIEQVDCIASERGRAVKLSTSTGSVRLTVSNPDTGSARMDVACDYDADPMDVGFNARYLLDILGHVESESAVLMLADPGSPCLITGADADDEGVSFVLMPMRV